MNAEIQKGLISVVMAAYNSEKYIAQAIASLQAQTYTNWELLVVNDGSHDNTEAVLTQLAAQDDRIQVISQANAGVSAARNAALARMRGEFFLIFDSDDYLPQHSLESRLKIMHQRPEIYFVDGQIKKKSEFLKKILAEVKTTFEGNPHQALMRLDATCFILPSWLIRRQPQKEYAMQLGMTHAEDLLFYIDISQNPAHLFTAVEDEILYYRVHENMAMKNLDGLKNGYKALYKNIANKYKAKFSLRLWLKYKISRIMFLSYLRNKEFYKAVRSLWHISLFW
jgi:glycosyltransferase involved in cell wall biosynthesis